MIAILLAKAKSMMGEDGDSNPPYGIDQPYFNAYAAGGYGDPAVRPLFGGIGAAAKALNARKSETGVRLFNDFFAPKLPAAKKTRNQGNGPTSFHQDFITFAVDRSGGATCWIPLEAYGPEAGTMSFINGSHKLGILGNYTSYDGKDIREVWSELGDLPMSDPIDYALGDVTIHNHLTVHGAGSTSSTARAGPTCAPPARRRPLERRAARGLRSGSSRHDALWRVPGRRVSNYCLRPAGLKWLFSAHHSVFTRRWAINQSSPTLRKTSL